MNTVKKKYNEIPETINVPKEFIKKKGEIISLITEENSKYNVCCAGFVNENTC